MPTYTGGSFVIPRGPADGDFPSAAEKSTSSADCLDGPPTWTRVPYPVPMPAAAAADFNLTRDGPARDQPGPEAKLAVRAGPPGGPPQHRGPHSGADHPPASRRSTAISTSRLKPATQDACRNDSHEFQEIERDCATDQRNDRSGDSVAKSHRSHQQPPRPPRNFPVGDTSLSLGLSRQRLPQVAIPVMPPIL
jgi:hypothetical protein